jgi:hypothetical protein
MKPKFSIGQILLNRNTKEKGTVQQVYDVNGITMYQITIPAQLEGEIGSNVSDWAEGVLEVEQEQSPVAAEQKLKRTKHA